MPAGRKPKMPKFKSATPPTPVPEAFHVDPVAHAESLGDQNRFKIVANGKLVWQANAGMQQTLFEATHPSNEFYCDEILIGGPRGPGKTAAGIAWMAVPVDNPNYIGLVLRQSNEELKEWIEKADKIYSQMGAVRHGSPVCFVFPTGARIWTGYITNDEDYEQYRGHEYHRILLEEAQQMREERFYAALFSSNRSSVPGLKSQILNTANPDGPGAVWLKTRFVKVIDAATGEYIPWGTPFYDPITKRYRIYIQGTRAENPQLMENDPDYEARLNDPAILEHVRRAWIYGDWDAVTGAFFPMFRERKMLGEPAEALHVIPHFDLPAWCHRWMSLDWGFQHHTAIYWYCLAPDGRIHVEQELLLQYTGSDIVGTELALACVPLLRRMRNPHLTVYVSPDAFQRKDAGNNFAEQIAAGIKAVNIEAVSHEYSKEEAELAKLDQETALAAHQRRIEMFSGAAPTIHLVMANNDRVGGWSYMRNMLRWERRIVRAPYSQERAHQIMRTKGALAYEEYVTQFQEDAEEILPKVLIHDNCPALRETIPKLFPDPKKPNDVLKFDSTADKMGDDPADSFRYGLMGYRDHGQQLPADVVATLAVERAMKPYAAESANDPNLRIQAVLRAAAAHQDSDDNCLTLDCDAVTWDAWN